MLENTLITQMHKLLCPFDSFEREMCRLCSVWPLGSALSRSPAISRAFRTLADGMVKPRKGLHT